MDLVRPAARKRNHQEPEPPIAVPSKRVRVEPTGTQAVPSEEEDVKHIVKAEEDTVDHNLELALLEVCVLR